MRGLSGRASSVRTLGLDTTTSQRRYGYPATLTTRVACQAALLVRRAGNPPEFLRHYALPQSVPASPFLPSRNQTSPSPHRYVFTATLPPLGGGHGRKNQDLEHGGGIGSGGRLPALLAEASRTRLSPRRRVHAGLRASVMPAGDGGTPLRYSFGRTPLPQSVPVSPPSRPATR